MNGSVVDRILSLMDEPVGESIGRKWLNGGRPCNNREFMAAANRVMGEQSPWHNWEEDYRLADEENRKLKRQLRQHDPAFAYHALTPRMVALWVTFLFVFASLAYGRPTLDLIVMERSGAYLSMMYKAEKELAEKDHQLELQQEVIDNLKELADNLNDEVEDIHRKMGVVEDGK